MRKKYFLSILLSFVSLAIFAQSGEISGKVIDENGEPIPFANITIVENGIPTSTGSTTDFDGFYSIKPLGPGKYDVKFSYMGYTSMIKTGVLVKNDKTTYLDQKLAPSALKIEEVVVTKYKIPLIDAGETSSKQTMTSEDIQNLPTREVTDIAATTAGVTKKGGELHFRGGRSDAVVYYVDGIRVNGKVNIPVTAVEQIDVVTGGVPSRYGEATGGVINISTKGGARKFTGGVEVLGSLDRWRYGLINLNVAGPIIKKKDEDGHSVTILGFAMSSEYQYQSDPSPSAVTMYKLKDSVLLDLQENPLYIDEGQIFLSAENITQEDLEETRIKPNVRSHDARLNLKFDLKLSDNMKFSIGGNGNFNLHHRRIDRYSLLNSENNPQFTTLNYRGFARFTHNLKKKEVEGEENQTKGFFQNGFYQMQFSYEKYKREYKDDSHGDNSFAYGYMGNFKVNRIPVFSTDIGYWDLISYSEDGVSYKPSDVNERGANYTSQFYELYGATADEDGYLVAPEDAITDEFTSMSLLSGSKALINGDRSGLPYDLWYNTGRQYNGHGIDNDNEQYSATINGGFDILKSGSEDRNKHSITFGVSFEQRILRKYTVVGPLGLWNLADQHLNSHLRLNEDEKYFLQNGEYNLVPEDYNFFMNDTIHHLYHHATDEEGTQLEQSTFDQRLRERIGADENDYIELMDLSLESLTRDLFSADELLNLGQEFVDYRGYDVYGNLTNESTTFADFWNKVDENGNKTRPIDAFKPMYMSGYIEDKFQLKDLTFRIGFRVDRYDANQMVLKDKYSIVGSQTVGEARNVEGLTGVVPDNITDDYIIYVDGQDNPTILGFRKGDKWFGKEGQELANYTAMGGSPVPLMPEGQVESPQDDEFKPELAFEKYKTDWNFMPRLQFSFNISDNALFFAHYDVLSQSPQSRIRGSSFINRSIASPKDYYFYNGGTLANPNLKSETTIDFQLGFKQKISKTSALTISLYFKEFKNQIQVRSVDGVFPFPSTYNTFDNIDFGNTKGFEFGYEMRRTNNLKLNVNYTLQFADGTGSDDRTQQSIVNNTSENFRHVGPLDYDSRHNFNFIVDYRFGDGDDYNGPTTKKGGKILSNFGVNLLTQLNSGTPYTKQGNVTADRSTALSRSFSEGTINGQRLGWNFNMDLKINKSFGIDLKSKKEDKEDTRLNFDVYLRVDNLLGIANVRSVYKYTGSAADDGWLGSASGQEAAENAHNKQSYIDLYKAGLNAPGHYSLPRRIFIGASVYF